MLASATGDNDDQKPVQFSLPFLAAIWLVMTGIGLTWIWAYEATPGEATQSPTQWPTHARVARQSDLPTLIMFAHPRCPCTRASLNELEVLMSHCSGRVKAYVLFFKPARSSREWERTDLLSSALSIPGVSVCSDVDGSEATRFGATTSGYVLLYDRTGQLIFDGGITGSRGHSGDNVGRDAIESFLLNEVTNSQHTFAFGCPLLGRDKTCRTESN